ncbi:hypothetical protein C8Q80DRAFT_1265412 [Daedaleopsis nitida]|nr:hypothetical protein C8Q80DRAFT_1265412 [Daedaleopsis nitida]
MSTRRTRVGKPPATQHKKATAAIKKEAPKATRATTRRSTCCTPKMLEVVEDEAEEVEEELENGSDKELETEKRLDILHFSDVEHNGVGSMQSSDHSVLVLTSDKDEDTPKRPDVKITPKRGRMRSRPTGNTVSPESPSPHKKTDTKGKNKTQPGGKHAARDPSNEEKSNTSAPFEPPACEFTTPKKASKPPNLHETFWTSTPSSNTKTEHMFTGSSLSSRTSSFVDVQELKGPLQDATNEEESQAGSGNDVTGSKDYVDLPLNKKVGVKQILGYPLRGEWERSFSTLGTVLREYKLAVPTYHDQNSQMPRAGVVFCTCPEEEAKSSKVFGLEATPTKQLAKAVGRGPAAGLRTMADKVLWSVDDDIPVWDARVLYKKNCLVANKGGIKWGDIQNLNRLNTDIPYGAIAVVFYIPLTFTRPANNSNSRNVFPASTRNTTTSVNLSLNLCGAALIADKPDDD